MKALVMAGVALAMGSGIAVAEDNREDALRLFLGEAAKQHNEMWAHGNTVYRIQACVQQFGPINCDDDGFVNPEGVGTNAVNMFNALKDVLKKSQQPK